jgi:hypothetical protein
VKRLVSEMGQSLALEEGATDAGTECGLLGDEGCGSVTATLNASHSARRSGVGQGVSEGKNVKMKLELEGDRREGEGVGSPLVMV